MASIASWPGGGPPPNLSQPPVSFPTAELGDLWVAASGDDAATGAQGAPLASIQAAVNRVLPGHTVWVMPGTYDGFAVKRSGAAGRPITVAGVPGSAPMIEPIDGSGPTIDLADAHDVALVNLAIDGPDNQFASGVYLDGSTGISLSGLAVAHTRQGFGIEVRFSSSVAIVGNEIFDNAVGIRLFGEGDSASVHDVVISGNRIHDTDAMVVNDPQPDNDWGANAIIWHKVTGRTSAVDNEIWASSAPSHDYGMDGGAFEIWGSSNMTISDNTVWNNENVMETGSDGQACDNITFVRNTAYVTTRGAGLILRCATNSLVAHNVLDSVHDFAIDLSDRTGGNRFATSIDGLRILDNIVVGTLGYNIENAIPASVEVDANLYWLGPHLPLARLPGRQVARSVADLTAMTGLDRHSLVGDPMFVDAGVRDYQVLAGSPCIDAGEVTAPGETYLGAAPDIGRYEGGVVLASPS